LWEPLACGNTALRLWVSETLSETL
jgi:hypothetical protein